MTGFADERAKTRIHKGAVAVAILAPLASLAYWPGLVTYDSVRQYWQAVDGGIDDWHPPIMSWIWRQILPLFPWPTPMILLQIGLLMVGLLALVAWTKRAGRPGLGLALAASALLPMSVALMGEVLKDCLMAGALTAATGLIALGHGETKSAKRWWATGLIVFASMLRFNAFPAAIPLLYIIVPVSWRTTLFRKGVALLGCLALTLSAMPITNRLIGAERSGVELSLMIFDIAGITEYSGQDQFTPLGLKGDTVAINHGCYKPIKWDYYSWWAVPMCPITFEDIRQRVEDRHIHPYAWWLGAIARHPMPYLEHRALHWNVETRFLLSQYINRPVQRESAPNNFGFGVFQTPAVDVVDGAALLSARTPLGWPCAWIALAAGILLVSRRLRTSWLITPLALSALLYASSYAVFGVAAELRYYLWTWMACAFAGVIAVADLRAGPARRRDWVLMFGPAIVVSVAAGISRFVI